MAEKKYQHLQIENQHKLNITSSKSNLLQNTTNSDNNKQLNLTKTQAITQKPDSKNVRVVCRFRPLNDKEKSMQSDNICVEIKDSQNVKIKIQQNNESSGGVHTFAYDRVFDYNASQQEVYEFAAQPVIESVLQGFNGTVFAYGQTSSGKTHTMQGPNIDDSELKGVIPRMVNTVFETIMNSSEYIEYTVKISIVEIYMEQIRDLLDPSKTNLKIRQDKTRGIYIEDVTEKYVSEQEEVYAYMKLGNSNRAISATNMNTGSSRSHLIFLMTIHQNNIKDFSAKSGKLFLVDLAGSEKVSKTGASGQLLEEAKQINQSLSTLGNVINALTDDKSTHIPYRNSKLTRILQESLGGNSRTTLIITCSPSPYNDIETLSTLRFGYRAKSIKNKPKINREVTVAELQLQLSAAEYNISKLIRRVNQLEDFIKKSGETPPPAIDIDDHNEDNDIISQRDTKSADYDENYSDNEEPYEKHKFKPEPHIPDNEQQALNELTKELENERKNLKSLTENLNNLKKEYALVNAKWQTTERENDSLINKIALLSLKVDDLEEIIKIKDEQIENLQAMQTNQSSELSSLKKQQDNLTKLIEERDQEIDKQELLLKQQKHELDFTLDYNQKIDKLINEIFIKYCNNKLFKDYFKDLCRDNDLVNLLQTLENQCSNNILSMQDYLVSGQYQIESEIQTKYNTLLDEYNNLKLTYQQISQFEVPKYEDIQKKVENDILQAERKKMEEEKQKIQNQFNLQIEKNSKLKVELQEERDKHRGFEQKLQENEKSLKKKVNQLERNLEQLTQLYYQLAQQRQMGIISKKKLERRNEKIKSLEKTLIESKKLLISYKTRCDYLKAFVMNNSIPTNDNILQRETITNEKSGVLDENSNAQDNQKLFDELLKRKSILTFSSAKIAKPIRGGGAKTTENEQNEHEKKQS